MTCEHRLAAASSGGQKSTSCLEMSPGRAVSARGTLLHAVTQGPRLLPSRGSAASQSHTAFRVQMKEGSEVGLCGQALDLGSPTPAFTHIHGRELSPMTWPAREATGGRIGYMTKGERGFAGLLAVCSYLQQVRLRSSAQHRAWLPGANGTPESGVSQLPSPCLPISQVPAPRHL